MSSLRVLEPLFGQVLGSPADDFVIAEWSDPGGLAGEPRLIAPLHLHHHDDEAWYVLEGVLNVQNGDELLEVPAGTAALVKAGTPHTYWNPRPGPARYLLIMTPRIYSLIQAIHALSERTPGPLRRAFVEHDSELL